MTNDTTVIQYKCPNCGGEVRFDPTSGLFKCQYCKSTFTKEKLDAQSVSRDQCYDAIESDNKKGTKTYTCPSCGAEIVTDDTTAATFCYYCHGPVVLSDKLDGIDTPDYVIPFKIDKDKAYELFTSWISSKKFLPKSFWNEKQIDEMTGIYFPYLLYSCDVYGDIEAMGTKKRISTIGNEEYTTTEEYKIARKGNMRIENMMCNGLSKNMKKMAEGILPYDTDNMQQFDMSYLTGFLAQVKDIDPSTITDDANDAVHNYAISDLRSSCIGYDNLRIVQDNTSIKNGTWHYALIPIWSITYHDKAKDKIYFFSVNGQTGKTVGVLPMDGLKLFMTFVIMSIIMMVILAIILRWINFI